MNQDSSAFDVPQKFVAKADIEMRPFDQTWDVADCQPIKIRILHDSNLGV